MRMSRGIDLKLRLTLRVAVLSACCFAAASSYALFAADGAARARAGGIADMVARDLELQQDRRHWAKPASGRFPDLGEVAPLATSGLCIAYRTKGGDVLQSVCNGTSPGETEAPAAFAALYRAAFDPGRDVVRAVRFGAEAPGEAVVSLDPAALIGQAWRDTSNLITVMAATLLVLCLLVHAAIARALRPTRAIRTGLERLAAGDLSTRLPAFDLAELSAIGTVFNQLAESLDRTLAERSLLTRKLIAVQDEERQHLARELHDEFGQCLAAIGALAASASRTAETECPALLPDCEGIGRTAAHMMDTVRGALVRLRPPDVDERGLATSLEGLVAGWNGRSRGRPSFGLEIRGSFDGLPPGFGAGLYRIAQEAITNAAKHAAATRVGLRLQRRETEIEMVVEDDGPAGEIELAGKSGLGLLGMRERVAALGGTLGFEAGRPAGFILRATLPAPPNGRAGRPA
ncbi:MAG TPA: histidine kinase [Aliidongia sp.]|nr:histidine kinase [Aliidongia sp.]